MPSSESVAPFVESARLSLLDKLPEVVLVLDAAARVQWMNHTGRTLMGYDLDDIVGDSVFDYIHPDDLNYMLASWEKRQENPDEPGLIVHGRTRHKDGSWRAYEVIGLNLLEDPDVGVMVCTCRDISRQSALADSPARLRSMVDRTTDVVLLLDADGIFVYANRRLTALTGHDSDHVIGSSWTTILDDDDVDDATEWFDRLIQSGDGASGRLQVRLRGQRDKLFDVELHGTNQSGDPLIEGVIVSARDTSELVAMQHLLEERNERLAHAATHDPLTGLLNRSAFVGAVDETITDRRDGGAAEAAGDIVVLFLDLDGFKLVNDTHGHRIGDRVLEEIADRLQQTLRPTDVAARYGGDEFTVVLDTEASEPFVSQLVARLNAVITEPILLGGITTSVGVSIGVSRSPVMTADVDSLLSHADAAMYQRKRNRRHDDAD